MTSSTHRYRSRLRLSSALALAFTTSASAREPAAVMLHTATCLPEHDIALRRAIEVELEMLKVEARWPSTAADGAPAPITLHAECNDDSVELEVWSSNPRLVSSRSVALGDVPEPARVRTLALVIGESLGPALESSAGVAAREPPYPPPAPSAAFEPEPEAAASGRAASRSRGGRAFGLVRRDPYGPADAGELPTTANPYGLGHPFRIGTAVQARMAMRDSSMLLGVELAGSGPLSDHVDWAVEASHSATATRTSELEARSWGAALGADFVHVDAIGFSAGPRLTFSHLTVSRGELFDPGTERTLATQLGARVKVEVPFRDRVTMQMTLGAHHTLGVYALGAYSGLDQGLRGWMINWGVGLAIEP